MRSGLTGAKEEFTWVWGVLGAPFYGLGFRAIYAHNIGFDVDIRSQPPAAERLYSLGGRVVRGTDSQEARILAFGRAVNAARVTEGSQFLLAQNMQLNPGGSCDIQFFCIADTDAIGTGDGGRGDEEFVGYILRTALLHLFAHIRRREFLVLGIKDQNVQIAFRLQPAIVLPPHLDT